MRGAFVVTDRPPPRRQLLTLTVVMPDGDELELNGLVARSVPPEQALPKGRPPGFGVQFYGLSRPTRQRWEKSFFRILTDRSPRSSPRPPLFDGGDDPAFGPGAGAMSGPRKAPSLVIVPDEAEPPTLTEEAALQEPGVRHERPIPLLKRSNEDESLWSSWYEYFHGHPPSNSLDPSRSEREEEEEQSPTVYRISLPTMAALQSFAEQASRAGGVLLRGVDSGPSGSPVVVSVVHPISSEELHLVGEVAPEEPTSAGVAVNFDGPPGYVLHNLRRFLEADGTRGHSQEPAPLVRPPQLDPDEVEDLVELSFSDLMFDSDELK